MGRNRITLLSGVVAFGLAIASGCSHPGSGAAEDGGLLADSGVRDGGPDSGIPDGGSDIGDAGSLTARVLADGLAEPFDLWFHGQQLYVSHRWTDPAQVESGEILRIPLDTGAPTRVAQCDKLCSNLSGNDTTLFWTDHTAGTVSSVPYAGGATSLVANVPVALGLAADNREVFFASVFSGDVQGRGLDGGAVRELANGQQAPWRVAINQDSVYWSNWNDHTIFSAPRSGGTPALFAANQTRVIGLALTPTHLMWLLEDGSLRRQSLDRASGVEELSKLSESGTALEIDQTHAYWTAWSRKAAGGFLGRVMRLTLATKEVRELFRLDGLPYALAVEERWVCVGTSTFPPQFRKNSVLCGPK